MIGLLRVLREHGDAVEADLSRYHHIDIRDRDVRDEHGRRKLTLRMILVRVRHLPPQSAVHAALGLDGWSVGDYLLADLFHAQAGKPHPARPSQRSTGRQTPARQRKLAAARRRAAERRAAIASTVREE